MNDDLEQRLGRLTPRGPRAELRPQVLAVVARRLQANRESRVFRRAALAVAVSLVLGVGLNVALSRASDQRMARLLGPPPCTSGDGRAAYAAYCEMLQRLLAETQPNPQRSKTSKGRPDFRGAANRALDPNALATNPTRLRTACPISTAEDAEDAEARCLLV